MNQKKGVSKKMVGIGAVVIAAAGFVFLPSLLAGDDGRQGGPGRMPGGAQTADTVFSVRTVNAMNRDLEAYIEINGDIINESQVAVNPDVGGRLVSLRVALGSPVRKGEVIARIDPSKPGSSYNASPVIAPISGTITSVPLTVGSTVSTASTIVIIAGSGGIEIEASIPEREVGQLTTGLKATVTLEAFPGEIFDAVVSRVSPVVDSNSRTKKIALTFTSQDNRINAGMFARIKLNTRKYEHVVTIPAEALVELRGLTGVYALDNSGEAVRFREVNAGVTVDGETEIRSGLESGAVVVVQGQQFLTDGAKVRVIARKV
jgi:multidrug efflux pump subunit AcrA (membrane-fusion protein)